MNYRNFYSFKHKRILLLLAFFKIIVQYKYLSNYKHFFITKSYYYMNSTIIQEKIGKTAIVILINAETEAEDVLYSSYCLIKRKNGKIERTRAIPAKLFTGAMECKIGIYRLVCIDVPKFMNDQTALLRFNHHTRPIELTLKIPNKVKRKLVVCPGRMFAFVQWHLFITAMELHRIHKVDLVVIYIQSVDHAVYELIKLYQADGLVEIRVGISMPPHLDTLGYNPNSESQWNDQLVNFEDCLYDFRESTEFIAFPDWDDLMMTDHSVPHSEILETFRNDFPKVGYYKIFRYLGAMPNLGTIMHKKYKLKHLWKHALLFTKNRTVIHQTLPKIIVRPKYINSVGLHDSYLAAGFIDKEISLDQLYMVHARDFDDYSLQTRLSAVDMMVKNFEKFSSSYTNITSVFRKVPKDDPFMDQFNHCLGYKGAWDRWSKMVKTAAKSIKSKCFTYFQCGMEKIKHRCYNARNTWIKAAQSKTQFVLKLSTNSFVKRNYCSV